MFKSGIMANQWMIAFFSVWLTTTNAETSLETLGAANNDFALELYEQIGKVVGDDGNIFFSPISVSTALAMTYAGAKGETANQMEEVLNFDEFDSSEELYSAFQELITEFNEPEKNYTLSLANRLFGRQGYTFLQTFLDVMGNSFNATRKELDFAGEADGSREYINEWVEDKTEDKIKDLLAPGTIDGTTVLVLVNAIYFKGDWDTPFDPEDTVKGYFHVSSKSDIQTDFMVLDNPSFNYGKFDNLDAKILELPYGNGEVAMYFVLPNKVSGLSKLEDKLDLDTLTESLDALQTTEIEVVKIPKFKLVQTTNMKKLLIQMGMEDLFGSDADLSGMNGARGLYVSEVVHKAFVDVNEKGTTAAAATAVIINESAALDPITFVADRPFLFFIRERSSGSILFMGRYANPPNGEEEKEVGEFGKDPNRVSRSTWSFWLLVLAALLTVLC